MENLINWETKSGTPIQVGEMTITPQAQALSLRSPFGGFVWNRPSGVLVEENGRVTQYPITDVTRRVILACIAITILVNLLAFFVGIMRFGGKK